MKRILVLLTFLYSVAQADDLTEAERLYNEGQSAFDAGRYGDAIGAWQRSYTLSQAPGLLYNLAQAYRLRGTADDCATAADHYRKFVALDPTSEQRALAERFEADAKVCARPTSSVPVPQPVPQPTTTPTPIGSRPRSPSRLPQLGLGLGIGGVALVGIGVYYGYRANALGSEVSEACAATCNWAVYGPKHEAGQSAETRQYVLVGTGVAAIVVGGALYWWGKREPAHLALVPRADGAAVTWSRTW